jgi:hypothetical protein
MPCIAGRMQTMLSLFLGMLSASVAVINSIDALIMNLTRGQCPGHVLHEPNVKT